MAAVKTAHSFFPLSHLTKWSQSASRSDSVSVAPPQKYLTKADLRAQREAARRKKSMEDDAFLDSEIEIEAARRKKSMEDDLKTTPS